MRIILVYQHFTVGAAGSSKPYDLACYLAGVGHDVTVICGRSALATSVDVPRRLISQLTIKGFNVICLGVKYAQQMSVLRRLWSFLTFTLLSMLTVCFIPRYDVLLASSTPLSVGLVGLVSRYIRRLPWVFEIRDFWPESVYAYGYLKSKTLFRIATFFEEWFYREARSVCAISQRMIRRLIERGFPANKLHFIPTGVDLKPFQKQADEQFRKRHGLENSWIAIYAGAHGWLNGLDYLIEAAEHLKNEKDIQIVLLGDGAEKPHLIVKAEHRGLVPHPLLFLPAVPRRKIPGILKACDAMLMINQNRPGVKDLMPNKFFDYLASGRPIVVNVKAELTEWILRYRCGVLSNPTDPGDLARILRSLKNDPENARRMGHRGLQLAMERFDRAKLHPEWETILYQAAFE